jgi:hypothetical protein
MQQSKIDDIEAGTLTFYDKDVDLTMAKDLEKRGIGIPEQIEDLWPKEQEMPSRTQSSQFQGISPNNFLLSIALRYLTVAPTNKRGRPKAVQPIQGNRAKKGTTQTASHRISHSSFLF